MPLTYCCLCGAETPRADVDANRVFAATVLTVCSACDDRETARRDCVCHGHGWLVSTSWEYGTIIERCDSCAVFVNDFAAAAAAKAAARVAVAVAVANATATADTSACEAFVDAVLASRGGAR